MQAKTITDIQLICNALQQMRDEVAQGKIPRDGDEDPAYLAPNDHRTLNGQ